MLFSFIFSVALLVCYTTVAERDEECIWKSLSGASYNLQELTITDPKQEVYDITDGDIPCTPETEPTYSFAWNFCGIVTNASVSLPASVCSGKHGAAMQYLNRLSDGYKECHVIGKYDPTQDDTHFSLLDVSDPSRGVSLKYSTGDKCPSGVLRSATIDVMCANTRVEILSALEPQTCQYHMVMKSYYGCPVECAITSNGLCNSHGHCAYDSKSKSPHCYCNEGYAGPDCGSLAPSTKNAPSTQSSIGRSMQISLLVVLLLIAVALTAVVGFMVYKIRAYRKEQADNYTALQSQGGSEHGGGLMEMQTF